MAPHDWRRAWASKRERIVDRPGGVPRAKMVLLDLFGGIRSACTYIGAATVKEMSKRTTFIRVTQQLNQVFGSHDLAKPGG